MPIRTIAPRDAQRLAALAARIQRDEAAIELARARLRASAAERAALQRLLQLGLHDGFRLFNDEAGIFSWWDYRQAAFRRNLGLRIDLTLVSDALRESAVDAGIDRTPRTWERASDHTPAWVQLTS